MSYFKKLRKKTDKMSGVSRSATAPTKWISFGNYCVNKIMSGNFSKGIGTGRLTQLAGPSGAGKSFIGANLAKAAQEDGFGVIVVDSENALDNDFMTKIGIDVDNKYYEYFGVNSITDCTDVVSGFMREYRELKEKDEKFPPFLILIDSLDMLSTDSEETNYEKGIIKGDMGQTAKQLKKMLNAFVHDIKGIDVAVVCTKQVYQEQDAMKKLQNPWVITESLKFAFSQILLVTKLLLKNKKTNKFDGIRLVANGHKTRFTKPFQRCTIEVPYDSGMDKFNGLLDAGIAMDIIAQNGAWYTFEGKKFQRSTFSTVQDDVLKKVMEMDDAILNVELNDDEIEEGETMTQAEKNKQRKTKNG